MPQASSTFATLPSEAAPVQGHGYHTNIKACHKAVWIPNGPTDPKDVFLFATPHATDAPQSKNTIVDRTRPPSARRTRTPLRSASARRREPLMPASRGSAHKRMVPYAAHPNIPAAAAAPGYPPGALPASKYTEADCYDEGNLPHTEAAHRAQCRMQAYIEETLGTHPEKGVPPWVYKCLVGMDKDRWNFKKQAEGYEALAQHRDRLQHQSTMLESTLQETQQHAQALHLEDLKKAAALEALERVCTAHRCNPPPRPKPLPTRARDSTSLLQDVRDMTEHLRACRLASPTHTAPTPLALPAPAAPTPMSAPMSAPPPASPFSPYASHASYSTQQRAPMASPVPYPSPSPSSNVAYAATTSASHSYSHHHSHSQNHHRHSLHQYSPGPSPSPMPPSACTACGAPRSPAMPTSASTSTPVPSSVTSHLHGAAAGSYAAPSSPFPMPSLSPSTFHDAASSPGSPSPSFAPTQRPTTTMPPQHCSPLGPGAGGFSFPTPAS